MVAEAYLRTWIPLVWRKLEVPARSDFVELQIVPTNYSPCDSRSQLMRGDKKGDIKPHPCVPNAGDNQYCISR